VDVVEVGAGGPQTEGKEEAESPDDIIASTLSILRTGQDAENKRARRMEQHLQQHKEETS